jgi:ribosome-binding ATPase YchF (GTP1/OBG family)
MVNNNHHCLEANVHVVDIGGIVNHHWLEAIVHVVDIAGIVDHHCFVL